MNKFRTQIAIATFVFSSLLFLNSTKAETIASKTVCNQIALKQEIFAAWEKIPPVLTAKSIGKLTYLDYVFNSKRNFCVYSALGNDGEEYTLYVEFKNKGGFRLLVGG